MINYVLSFPSLTILILFFSYLMAAVVIKFRLPALDPFPSVLLLPLGLGLFRSSPFWSYYLYPQGCNFHKGIDGLCGEVIRHTGSCVSEQSCHIFPDRSRSRLHILYRCDDEYRLECRRLNRGSFLLKKEERKKDFLQISWNRLNELLTVKKYRKTVEK